MADCLLCGEPDHQPPQSCTGCGSRFGLDDGFDTPAARQRYRQYLRDHYFHGQEGTLENAVEAPSKPEDLKARTRLRVSLALAREVDAEVRAALDAARPAMAVRLSFDSNLVGALAREDTQLRFRLSNHSGMPVHASLYWDDPETEDEEDFLASTPVRIKPGGTGEIKGQVVFARAGRKSISEMYLCIEQFGETALLRLHPFDFFVGNPNATVINQYHTTNHVDVGMGAIVKGAEFGAAGAKAGAAVADDGPQWIPVSFSFVHDDELIEPKAAQAARFLKHVASTPVPAATAVPSLKPSAMQAASMQAMPPGPATPPSAASVPQEKSAHTDPEPQETAAAPAPVDPSTPAPAPAQAAAKAALPTSFDPGPFELLQTGARALFEICARYAGGRAIASVDCSLPLLKSIFPWVPDPEMSGILGVLVEDEDSITFDARRTNVVTGFEGPATVISAAGITRLEMEDGDLSLLSMELWHQLPTLALDAQNFGRSAFIIEFGDEYGAFPGCVFDQRHEPDDAIPAVCETANKIIARLRLLDGQEAPSEDEPPAPEPEAAPKPSGRAAPARVAPAWPFTGHEAQDDEDDAQDEEDEDEEEEDEGEALIEDDPAAHDQTPAQPAHVEVVARALNRFLSVFSLATQRCSEALPRTIYLADHVSPDLLFAAWESTQLAGTGMRAVCIDPAHGQWDEAGRLTGWSGPASVLSIEGIYHLTCAPGGQIRQDGSHCFLSWRRLFSELGADLYIRDLATDLWLGVPDKFFFIGAYCDYSPAVMQWDYFEEFVKNELLASFEAFKEAVMSA